MELAKLESEAKRLMDEHGLTAAGWKFEYIKRKRSFGCCFFGSKRITVSRRHAELDPEKHVLDTLRHEVAHALAGKKAGHGPEWKEWARKLGATPERCANKEVVAECHKEPGKWQAVCPACGHTFHAYRKPRSTLVYWCTRSPNCGRKTGKLVYREVEQSAKSTGKRVNPAVEKIREFFG